MAHRGAALAVCKGMISAATVIGRCREHVAANTRRLSAIEASRTETTYVEAFEALPAANSRANQSMNTRTRGDS
jgi:hypothetical protein